jgi:heme/copper-type cytochrome/quinol oxidase subunit 3
MSSSTFTTQPSVGDAGGISKKLTIGLWVAVVIVGAYFVLTNVPAYFIWSEESYGPYYWQRAGFVLPHVVGGLVALVIGPFQFWPRIRNGHPKVHRISGRIYLVSVCLAASAGLALSLLSARGLTFGSGLFSLSLAWLLISGMAYVSIRRRNFIQHKQWMIRSYVVTFAFVTFRLCSDALESLGIGGLDRISVLSWATWAIPLLITELIIQGKQVFAGGSRQAL